MADATLIQGARQLAEAQSGVNTGAAFGVGYDKAMARNQAEMNRMLKQQQAAEKRAKDILKEGDKYMREYVVKGVNSVIKGETGGLTTEDMQHATEYLTAQKGALSEGKTLLEKGYSVSDPEAIKKARFMGEEAESNAVSFHNQLSLLQGARKEYAALKNSGNLATVEGNIKNIENANRLMTSNWSVKEGEIVFDDGTRLVDISLPYTTDIGKGFMEWAGSETDKVSKMTATELNKATTKKENIRSTAEGYFSGKEGVDRLEVLLSQQYFKSLNTGFANIVLDRENPQVAIDQAVEATVNAIYGVAKKDSPAAGVTPPPGGFSETPTNQVWIKDVGKLAKANVATEILAPNGDYVIIIPKGVEYKGFAAKEDMMRIVGGVNEKGKPIYQIRPLDQGIIQTKKRK